MVIDDGSTDGTSEMVIEHFPAVQLIRHEESQGYIVRRNEAAKSVSADFIFSIDDDAEFSSPHVVAQTLREFDDDRIGAVAIPFINVHHSPRLLQHSPDKDQVWIADSFIGTAHALRRDVFLKIGGFWEPLIHQGEESDFCIRMLDRGHVVRLGCADPVFHHLSANRDLGRVSFYGNRNNVLFAWRNVPWPYFGAHFTATFVNTLVHTLRSPVPCLGLKGLGASLACCVRMRKDRSPVRSATYRRFRTLRKNGPRRLAELGTM
jgi:glycosyltransferase involved in cell wall biosynthesis